MSFNFNPVGGLTDSSAYPTAPATEAAARAQIQAPLNQLRDFINGLKLDNVPACRVWNSTNVSIANNTMTTVPFNTEVFDTDNIYNPAIPDKLTCNTAGKYLIFFEIHYSYNSVGGREVYIHINDTTIVCGVTKGAELTSNYETVLVGATICNLAANDYVKLYTKQTSGGALNSDSNNQLSPIFGMVKVG